jgi:UDP-4-amino-4,6-dideoxy-N-acetyl-beta-L-altrosamine transaminase
MSDFIPYGRQDISEQDIQAVIEVLRSDWLTQGPAVPAFEQAVAAYCDVPYALAANSATSALHLACRALDVGAGDLVWTSPITFVASANAALYCGAEVDFVDVDSQTANLSVSALTEKLQRAERVGRLPKVLIPVHMGGLSCDMQQIAKLAKRYGFRVIEDASHAVGGRYQGRPIGNCRYSDISIFSFHPVKIMTTAEGGMALTGSAELAQKIDLLRSHGVTRDPQLMQGVTQGPWYYQQIDLGFNYRMTDLQAALGLSQLQRLDQFIDRRARLADRYDRCLAELPVNPAGRAAECDSAWHLYVIRLQLEQLGKDRLAVFNELRAAGIGVNVHYIPVHTQPYYRQFGFADGDFPNAENYYATAISLPLFYRMTEAEQDRVVATLKQVLR